MARATGPLMSFGASGSIGKTITFASWKGRPYVRRLVIPHNPKSPAQTSTRAMMKFLTQQWSLLSAPDHATWAPGGDSMKVSPFNYFVSYNMKLWTQDDAPSQAFPATTVAPTVNTLTLTATPGVGEVTLDATIVAAADVWGIVFEIGPTGFTSSRNNVVGIILATSLTGASFVKSALKPGNYDSICYSTSITGGSGTQTGPTAFVIT